MPITVDDLYIHLFPDAAKPTYHQIVLGRRRAYTSLHEHQEDMPWRIQWGESGGTVEPAEAEAFAHLLAQAIRLLALLNAGHPVDEALNLAGVESAEVRDGPR